MRKMDTNKAIWNIKIYFATRDLPFALGSFFISLSVGKQWRRIQRKWMKNTHN